MLERAAETATGPPGANVFAESALMFAILGLLVSVAIVLSEEIYSLSAERILMKCVIALSAGAALGGVAGFVGQGIFSFLLRREPFDPITLIIARTLGWAAVGAGIGLAAGLPSGSARKCFQGVIGGFIGGAAGGIVFDFLAIPLQVGTVSRFVGDTAIGCAVGAAVMLVEEATKVAWVTVVAGRNKGKQYILAKPVTTIGRDELSDIPLFGDLNVQKRHAEIRTSDWRTFVLHDLGSTAGTLVNGVRVAESTLSDGDWIQIGSFQLVFNQRTQAPMLIGAGSRGEPIHSQQTALHPESTICPFCGGPRDPITGACACTPTASTAPQPVWVSAGVVPRLIGISGVYAGYTFDLSGDRTDIGRDPANSLVLDKDQMISRRHAVLMRQGETYVIQDLGSTNGTYVNGVRVQSAVLNRGDVVQFGSSSFRFER
ncbi:MAG: FHA domain-containing protein [Armatimonadota bacterium]|nr:FHA domain-containing protein [Armatimonadota bacterium]